MVVECVFSSCVKYILFLHEHSGWTQQLDFVIKGETWSPGVFDVSPINSQFFSRVPLLAVASICRQPKEARQESFSHEKESTISSVVLLRILAACTILLSGRHLAECESCLISRGGVPRLKKKLYRPTIAA
jgi:hypothetical protein